MTGANCSFQCSSGGTLDLTVPMNTPHAPRSWLWTAISQIKDSGANRYDDC